MGTGSNEEVKRCFLIQELHLSIINKQMKQFKYNKKINKKHDLKTSASFCFLEGFKRLCCSFFEYWHFAFYLS